MLFESYKRFVKPLIILTIISLATGSYVLTRISHQESTTQSYILSAKDFSLLKEDVASLGLTPSHELAIINALAIELSKQQLTLLQDKVELFVTPNYQVKLAYANNGWRKGQRRWQPKAAVNQVIDATSAHQVRNFGDAVTIGFLDTGLDQLSGLSTDLYGKDKAWGTYDAINNTLHNYDDEANGHGTHVASIAGNSDFDINGKLYGVAPNASIVGIKAFDYEGKATYADVIRGIEWAIQVKDQINLRILNMSFSGPVRSLYWQDPLNQAVMKAWQSGIVVIASSGNKGPEPMTVGVPGNVPYIITVGAMTDFYTESNTQDDKLASFSSAGPTPSGFVKPDILAPGGHISGLMSFDSEIVTQHPEFHDGGRYFEMSGTSQAAGVISGVVALMLTDNPNLSPDDVKCRLMDSAHHALDNNGKLAYSVFQQGAGVVNAKDAIESSAFGCANQSLNIAKDLAGENHFFGPANIDENGNFYIEGLGEEYVWQHNQKLIDGSGLIWKNHFVSDGLIWKNSATTDGLIWKNNFETKVLVWDEQALVDGLIWKNNLQGSEAATIAVNNWVDQE
ncbi:S8 family peptidase [Colwellia sp. RSH04]|uniref:S8 family peptidase n=1 Tax=Colwellia sp. RSH04 TaxID=2305464 RepID=UPI000E573F1B|nr:S8 family peptidase [Colwellia sp. RSH04]RHW75455.1 alkaline serine protease [Colwellia sp. RSH04]